MKQIQIQSDSPERTQALAATLAKSLRGGDVLALDGDLGAGKTVFVRGLAQGLGIPSASVSSPTFVIRQEYQRGTSPTLVHIDAYRLHGPDDLETIGWSELLQERDVIIAVEWPSRIEHALPQNCIRVAIAHVGPLYREITITVPTALVDRFAGLVSQPLPDESHLNAATQSATPARAFKCRRCGEPVLETSPTFPFCSKRCRLADLGKWFNEGYKVSREIQADELTD